MKAKKFRIIVSVRSHSSYYYYPSISCKTKDGEMKMMADHLARLESDKIDYTTRVELHEVVKW